jgi:hypothetical protein
MKWHGGRVEAVYSLKNIEQHREYIEGIGVQDVERGKVDSIKDQPWQQILPWDPGFTTIRTLTTEQRE